MLLTLTTCQIPFPKYSRHLQFLNLKSDVCQFQRQVLNDFHHVCTFISHQLKYVHWQMFIIFASEVCYSISILLAFLSLQLTHMSSLQPLVWDVVALVHQSFFLASLVFFIRNNYLIIIYKGCVFIYSASAKYSQRFESLAYMGLFGMFSKCPN